MAWIACALERAEYSETHGHDGYAEGGKDRLRAVLPTTVRVCGVLQDTVTVGGCGERVEYSKTQASAERKW
jgi:hypothetical protein